MDVGRTRWCGRLAEAKSSIPQGSELVPTLRIERGMKLLAAALILLPASLTLLPGCPLACGGWEGKGDTMYRSDKGESVFLCTNGGYSATLNSG